MTDEQNKRQSGILDRLSVLGEEKVSKIIEKLQSELQQTVMWPTLTNEQQTENYLDALDLVADTNGL